MRTVAAFCLLLLTAGSLPAAGTLDLTKAVVVAPQSLSARQNKAITMLVEEVEKRTRIRWPVVRVTPRSKAPVISIVLGKGVAEGYRIEVRQQSVLITGNDSRGVLFGVGRLLRELRMQKGSVSVADDLRVTTAPKYSLRGHQLGYRPKTNSYDAWSLPIWEQYIRDLAVFGTNTVELIPPRSDDDADSPHFPLPPMEMMVGMSKLLDAYGLDVWIWYPAMDKDYSDPKTVEFALNEWGEVFRKLPRVDAVFVPGGDPGHTQPQHLMALLEKQTAVLHRYHPRAQMWVSPQSFDQKWMEEFLEILRKEPVWLSGVVFGPQVRMSLPQLRAAVPKKYPIRHYPDITHSRQCQYPVPNWDVAYAVTEGREGINPRPLGQARIFRLLQPYTVGFITYSEGCNDDVNKIIWSSLGWDPNADVALILQEYSRYFISTRYQDSFAQGLLALERNWQGPLLANSRVSATLEQFQSMEKSASPQDLLNWRFQQGLYRAYYDAYTADRLRNEMTLEERATDRLRDAKASGSLAAMSEAEQILDSGVSQSVTRDWRARVFELAEALFQSIRMQLSVVRYKAISVDRGANLDTIDVPLNNRLWLKSKFAALRQLTDERERLRGIADLVSWTDPGPGGFYDELGDPAGAPHLVRGPGFEQDPAFLESALIGFGPATRAGTPMRRSWWRHAEALGDAPLKMRYTGLDPAARYKIRVLYAGDSLTREIRLTAGDGTEVHPFMPKPAPIRPVEFDIPEKAIRNGELVLTWTRQPGLGGNGRGNQVSEVWLIRK